jgi:hypothetical protein
MSAIADDLRDKRSGAYDPANEVGKPQPDQVREERTPHQNAQPGADVRGEPLAPESNRPPPEGLRRARKGPLNKRSGRRSVKPEV